MNKGQTTKTTTFSPQDFAALGLHQVAYVRPEVLNNQIFWSIHAADGTELARLVDRDTAFAACRQNELEPLSVH